MGSSSKAKLPDINQGTGGLYGSASSKGGFNPNDFQRGLVDKAGSGIMSSLNQLERPSYDSESFKARNAQLNKLGMDNLNTSLGELSARGVSRGSATDNAVAAWNNNMNDQRLNLMASEDQRINNVLNQYMNAYNMPYQQLMGLQGNANALAGAQMGAQAQKDTAMMGMYGGIAQGVGSVVGG